MHRLTRISLRHPLLMLLGLVLVTAGLSSSLPRIKRDFGYRVLLGGDHPAIQRLEVVMDRYGGGYPAYIVWRCGDGSPCESVFDASALQMAASIEDSLRDAEVMRAVLSPVSASLLLPADGGFAAMRITDIHVDDTDERRRFIERALEDSMWKGQIVSPDGRTGAIVILSSDARSDKMALLTDAVFSAVAPFEAAGWEFHLSGKPIEQIVAGRDLAASTEALTPLIAIIVAAIVFFLTRSWQSTLITMLGMGVALVWTFGFLSWMSWPQDSILEVLAPFIMTIGTCDAVHFLSQASANLKRGSGDTGIRGALEAAAKEVGPACVMTTLTTAAALASFSTSNLGTFVRFGTTAAFGTVACLVVTFTLIPILATKLALPPSRGDRDGWHALLASVIETAERRSISILVVTSVIVLVCGIGLATRLRVGTEVSEMYGDQNRVTQWTRYVERHLRGLESLEVDIGLPSEESVLLPESQQKISEIINLLEAQPGLGKASSIQDVMGQLNRVLHDDDIAYQRTADSIAGNGELLELISFDSPELLDSWISPDRRRIRISVEADSAEPAGSADFAERIRMAISKIAPEDWDITLTGSYILDIEWTHEVQETQIRSFGTAFAIVLLLVTVFLRSPLLGLVAMLPALVPVIVVLGFLGWTDLPLDVGRLMIAAIVIGIGVDDSIHLLRSYQAYRAQGKSGREAMRAALHRVGRALVITSFALALGFVALTLSAWQTISSFGFFVCMAVLVALVTVLFVLPAVFFVVFGEEEANYPSA